MSRRAGRFHVVLWCALGSAGTVPDAIHESDLILVGDVVGGSAVDHVSGVECSMLVHPDRILKGDVSFANRPIEVHWQYQPRQDQPPQVTTRIERPHALWFLRKSADGRYEAMWVEVNLQNRGGYYLQLPPVEPYAVFAYGADAVYERKVAGELGAAMEQIAQEQGSNLDVHWRNAASPGPPPPAPSPEVLQFRSLAFAFRQLDAANLQDVAAHLAASPLVHLKALGLVAQLKAKNRSALLELDRNQRGLTMTNDPLDLSFWANTLEIRGDAEAIGAVGRIALGDAELLGFTDGAVHQLSRAGSPAAIPYLEVMLNHPKEDVRTLAAGGICAALNTLELGDIRDGACTPPQSQALQSWLSGHRQQLSAFLTFPRLQIPPWYQVAPEPPRREVEVSMERRFEHLLIMLEGSAAARINDRFPAFGLRNLEPADAAALDAICRAAAAKRKALDEDYQRLANVARVQGKDVDPGILPGRARQYEQIATDGLSESQGRLSADAWLQLQQFLRSLPLHEYVPKAPNPFFVVTPAGGSSHP